MKRIIKCGTAFLLALVLCLCLLPTTAFAASKQVYIWNFPLSDDTLKSSGNWGHGVLNLRFGYRVGASSYTQFRCLDSWQGEVAYCIEPGAPQKNYDSITDHDDTWWDHLSLPDGHPLTPREVQRQIGRIMSYGYHGTIGGGWWADVESTAEKMAWAYATQVLIWEVVAGERDSSFHHIDVKSMGYDEALERVDATHPLRSKILSYYDSIVDSVQTHSRRPSFCASTATNTLSQTDAEAFVACFCETETRGREETGETYEVAVPLPMEEVYAQLSVWRGRAVTAEERSNAVKIYSMVMGSAGGGTYNGAYEPGGNAPMELEASLFTDPATKNSADLAIYAANAWNSGWGYVWGTFGQVLTPELLQYKISQYPEGVGDEANFIRSHWLNRRTTDCVGLIKGYGWLNTETMEIQYGSNGMPDVGADGMYYNAGRKGSIETMPDTPGLAVWKSGHIGVYIGSGEVIEAMDTRYGVVKTKLQGRGWSHWLEVPGIKYD